MNSVDLLNALQKVPVRDWPVESAEAPHVIIFVFTFNHAPYIRQCLDGILNQKTDFPFQIYIGEDDSTDDTLNIVREYRQKFPHLIRLVEHKKENKIFIGGKPTGRFNALYAYATSAAPYFAICEGDDVWTDENKLQEQVNFLQRHPECRIHCTSATVIDEKGNEVEDVLGRNKEKTSEYALKDLVENNRVITCTAVFRSEGMDRLPVLYTKAPAGDWIIWVYLLNRFGGSIFMENRDTAAYRVHAGGIFSSLNTEAHYRFYEKNLKVISKFFEDSALRKKALNRRNWYLEQLFRCELTEGRKWKALGLLPDMLWHSYTFKSMLQLLAEWRQSLKK